MKEIRQFLDAMAEARSLADVNIAAGSALPVVSRFVRRVVAIGAITMLVTTAALAHGYTRLDHRLKQANEQHTVMIRRITTTTKKQQRVMVAKIVQVTRQREQLADAITQLRSKPAQIPAPPSAVVGRAEEGVVLAAPAPAAATEISATVPENVPPATEPAASTEQPAEPAPVPPAAPPAVSSPPPPPPSPSPPPGAAPKPPPPPATVPPSAAPSPPPVAGVQPPAEGTGPPSETVGEPSDPEPTPDPAPPSSGIGG
jgi:hypothetical protein